MVEDEPLEIRGPIADTPPPTRWPSFLFSESECRDELVAREPAHELSHVSYDTLYFAVFLAFVWMAFRLLPWHGCILLAASIAFYAVSGLRDTVLATVIILTNYLFQFLVLRDRRWLYLGLTLNFGCLAYFKYRVFITTAAGLDLFTHGIVIPLGISFYIFQLSSFLIDLSRRRAEPFTSLPRFALFKLFFGQLVAGPIMRWRQFGPQVNRLFEQGPRPLRLIILGLGLMLLGLVKKVLLADLLTPFVDDIFRAGPAGAPVAWLGVWLFSFQVYFDFSGYSDIALGLGYLFGLKLAVNFRQPYLARSPGELWRRWHITLTTWIRDYLFMPMLRQMRSGPGKAFALIAAMTLAGLWHGPNWTFVTWGFSWGVVLLLWHLGGDRLAWLGPGTTVVTFGIWLTLAPFFRAVDLGSAVMYIGTMFGVSTAGNGPLPQDNAGGLLIAVGCLLMFGSQWAEAQIATRRAVRALLRHDGPFLRALFIGTSLWLVLLPKVQNSPFLYFRF